MLYRLAQRALQVILPRYFDWSAHGAHHLPDTGPAIVVSNHVNYLDPLAMGATFDRPLHFMAKKELFEYPVFGWLLRKVHAFPVRRGKADRHAIRRALQVLADGHVLALFPEGTRSATGDLQEFQRGAAMLALRSGAPVIPMVILGAHEALAGGRKLPRRGPLTVRVGPPLHLHSGASDSDAITEASQRIHEAMAALYPNGAGAAHVRITESNNHFRRRKSYSSEGKKI